MLLGPHLKKNHLTYLWLFICKGIITQNKWGKTGKKTKKSEMENKARKTSL